MRYRIHIAKTARDCCNECDRQIQAGDKYIALRAWNDDGETRFVQFHHYCWGEYKWQRDAINDRPNSKNSQL